MLLKVLLKATVCVVAGLKEHGQISFHITALPNNFVWCDGQTLVHFCVAIYRQYQKKGGSMYVERAKLALK